MDFDVILGMPGEPLDRTVVLSTGTAMPKGCRENSEAMLKNVSLPIEILPCISLKICLTRLSEGS